MDTKFPDYFWSNVKHCAHMISNCETLCTNDTPILKSNNRNEVLARCVWPYLLRHARGLSGSTFILLVLWGDGLWFDIWTSHHPLLNSHSSNLFWTQTKWDESCSSRAPFSQMHMWSDEPRGRSSVTCSYLSYSQATATHSEEWQEQKELMLSQQIQGHKLLHSMRSSVQCRFYPWIPGKSGIPESDFTIISIGSSGTNTG